jgi:hypothetical protein
MSRLAGLWHFKERHIPFFNFGFALKITRQGINQLIDYDETASPLASHLLFPAWLAQRKELEKAGTLGIIFLIPCFVAQ